MPSTYPVVQNNEKAAPEFQGHALCENLDQLDDISMKYGVSKLSDFAFVDLSELSGFLGEAFNVLAQEEWFDANDGLVTVTVLLEQCIDDEELRSDLLMLSQVLAEAKKSNSSWRLQHDI